jgi:eukaryotic-like serine/threonine-protein kinase
MTPLHPGDRLDHYRLETLIASSGMASIFRATDLRDWSAVAIKLPHPEAELDPIFHDRFRREIEIGARLDHPGIRKIFPPNGSKRLYMAMEWLDGRLLRLMLAEGRLVRERALAIAAELLAALDYMHRQGVVHRDLKPENIMVGENGGHIKIIDFGIASLAGSRRLTFGRLSQVMGSPDYISPEQVNNKRGDARSDVYAAGAILFEMLTGRTPFEGSNPFALMNARLTQAPCPPSEIDPSIPPHLEAVVLRALERDPERRYASARDFAHDLAHPHEIPCADRLVDLRREAPRKRSLTSRLMRTLIPMLLLAVLLYVARAN